MALTNNTSEEIKECLNSKQMLMLKKLAGKNRKLK
jgi:hypothetical protein